MNRKWLFLVSLGLLAGVARPGSADPKFLEPYGNIFGARTFLSLTDDARVKDALQNQPTGDEDGKDRFLATGFYRRFDLPRERAGDLDVDILGGGLAYARGGSRRAWSLNFNFIGADAESGADSFNLDGFDISAKFVVVR